MPIRTAPRPCLGGCGRFETLLYGCRDPSLSMCRALGLFLTHKQCVVETGQMSSAETGQMSAVKTGQMSAVATRQMSSAEVVGQWGQNGRQRLSRKPRGSGRLKTWFADGPGARRGRQWPVPAETGHRAAGGGLKISTRNRTSPGLGSYAGVIKTSL